MSDDNPTNLPPRPETYPGGAMPDHCIGGTAEGAQSGGVARLLDAGTGQPVTTVMESSVRLTQGTDGRWSYLFEGVPRGSYRVEITLDSGQTSSTGTLSTGTVGSVTF